MSVISSWVTTISDFLESHDRHLVCVWPTWVSGYVNDMWISEACYFLQSLDYLHWLSQRWGSCPKACAFTVQFSVGMIPFLAPLPTSVSDVSVSSFFFSYPIMLEQQVFPVTCGTGACPSSFLSGVSRDLALLALLACCSYPHPEKHTLLDLHMQGCQWSQVMPSHYLLNFV